MMKRLTGIFSIDCLLILFLFTANCSAAPLFESTLGVNHHFTLNAEQDARDIDVTRNAGFRLIRYDLTWAMVERQKGVYDFLHFDRLLEQMTAQGIRPLFILDYNNLLYGEMKAIRSAEQREAYARFAAAAAARYKGKGIVWEIWNEPNVERAGDPAPNPYEYMKLVIDAATAMRVEDSDAYIIGPGVSGVDYPFVETCINVGLLRYVNAVSIHPYRSEQPETTVPDYERLKALIQQKQPPGKQIPLVVSEWGYSSASFRGDEQKQARYLTRMFLVNAFAEIDFTIWYDFRNDGPNPREGEHNFGLLRPDGAEKPAMEAARAISRQLSARRFFHRLNSREKDYLLEFVDAQGKPCFAVWTIGGEHEVSTPETGKVKLTQTPQFVGCR